MNKNSHKTSENWKRLEFKYSLKFLLLLALLFFGAEKSFASLTAPDEIYRVYQLVQDWDITGAEKL